MTMEAHPPKSMTLPWAPLFGRRCRARLSPDDAPHDHGRCDLVRDHDGPHALERGMHTIRWTVVQTVSFE